MHEFDSNASRSPSSSVSAELRNHPKKNSQFIAKVLRWSDAKFAPLDLRNMIFDLWTVLWSMALMGSSPQGHIAASRRHRQAARTRSVRASNNSSE
jgi:hypothetical protein